MNGGALIAEVLARQGARELFTLCGGHISPVLVEAKARGIAVVDVRDERSAVFAADAVSRLTGRTGVAAVTAGPGVTNALTAVKNAELAQSPLVLLGGATATLLDGRGSLQDIDQRALLEPHVKWWGGARRVRELAPLLEHAFQRAREGVPGPVFLECPVDLLYPEEVVREWTLAAAGSSRKVAARLARTYLEWHVLRVHAPGRVAPGEGSATGAAPAPLSGRAVRKVVRALARSRRPVLLVGSQATLDAGRIEELASAVGRLGVPTWLSGTARGLLGAEHPMLSRHRRREALAEADLVLLAGVPCDFRLGYGRPIGRARLVSVNLSAEDLTRNRRPDIAVLGDPAELLLELVRHVDEPDRWASWRGVVAARDTEREGEIRRQAAAPAPGGLNPLALCAAIDEALDDDSIVVTDGGDFVATASYVVRPRGPLRWLDPGVFGTLGVGGGFALGAAWSRPRAEVWLLWGDGSAAFSLAEIDTFARHGRGLIAVIGNDASWAQIARDQVAILGDDVGTVLARSDYHRVAEGYGGVGLELEDAAETGAVLAQAKRLARQGRAVVVNARLGASDFRKGSLSM